MPWPHDHLIPPQPHTAVYLSRPTPLPCHSIMQKAGPPFSRRQRLFNLSPFGDVCEHQRRLLAGPLLALLLRSPLSWPRPPCCRCSRPPRSLATSSHLPSGQPHGASAPRIPSSRAQGPSCLSAGGNVVAQLCGRRLSLPLLGCPPGLLGLCRLPSGRPHFVAELAQCRTTNSCRTSGTTPMLAAVATQLHMHT